MTENITIRPHSTGTDLPTLLDIIANNPGILTNEVRIWEGLLIIGANSTLAELVQNSFVVRSISGKVACIAN